ncbi:hypothetical protein GAMM_10105 [Gammaproteobacteria bacterium]
MGLFIMLDHFHFISRKISLDANLWKAVVSVRQFEILQQLAILMFIKYNGLQIKDLLLYNKNNLYSESRFNRLIFCIKYVSFGVLLT